MHQIPKPYKLISYLGRGKSAYSYLVEHDGVFYVYKKIHHEPIDFYHFGDKFEHELLAYEKLSALHLRIPKIIEVNPKEEYLIKEYIEGLTIAEAISQGIIRTDLYRAFYFKAKAIEQLDLHIDYFPTNFVIQNDELIYIDYEINRYEAGWGFIEWGSLFWFNQEGFALYLKDYRDTSKILNNQGMPDPSYVWQDYERFLEDIKDLDQPQLWDQITLLENHAPSMKSIDKLTGGFAATTYQINTSQKRYIYKIYKDKSQNIHFDLEVKAYQEELSVMPKMYAYQALHDEQRLGWILFEYIDGPTLMAKYESTHDLSWASSFASSLKAIHQISYHATSTTDFVLEEIKEIETINEVIQDSTVKRVLMKLKTTPFMSMPLCRIHGDYHPWNVIIGHDRSYVIDWFYRIGDYRYDLFWAYSLLYRNHYDTFAHRFMEEYTQETLVQDSHFFIALANLRWFVNVKQSLMIKHQPNLYQNVNDQLMRLNELVTSFMQEPIAFTL